MAEDSDRVRVLVIDGSRNVRDFVAEQVLIPHGYKPILARDGAEGLRKALTEVPDLILMDYELPMMSSRDVLEALRARPLRIPVILMTSRGSEQVAVRLIRLGVRDYLVKPFTTDQLLQAIEHATFEIQLRRDNTALAGTLGLANRKIKQCLVEFSIFAEIGKAVSTQMPLDDLLERIVDAALYITHSEECILMLNDPETGHRSEKVAKRRPRGAALPLIPYSRADLDPSGKVAAMFHIPLRVGKREIGVLNIKNKTMPRSFTDHERQMLNILADYAAIAIENVRLLRQLEQAKSTKEASRLGD